MPRLTSEHFVDRTSVLLRERCGADVTMSMVLEACGAQKGSLYHFFPGGKDELLAAAVNKTGACAAAHIQMCIENSESAAEAIQKHLHHIAKLIDQPDSPIGLPFVTLSATVGALNTGVRDACDDVITTIETLYFKQLVKDGFSTREARGLATFSVFAVEGAIARSHASGNTKPLKLAVSHLTRLFSG